MYIVSFSQDQSEYNSTAVRSQTNTAVIRGLKPGSIYVFQVRARTVAGFGRYSGKLYFQTMTEGENLANAHQSTQGCYHLSCVACRHTTLLSMDSDSCGNVKEACCGVNTPKAYKKESYSYFRHVFISVLRNPKYLIHIKIKSSRSALEISSLYVLLNRFPH